MKRLVIGISVVGAALAVGYVSGQANSIATTLPVVAREAATAVSAPPPTVEVSPVVLIQAMEKKFEVTTFSMNLTVEAVTVGRCNGNWWQDTWWRDCLKMKVPGTVNAGFGRDILDPTRITATKDTVTYDLGAPTIHPKVYVDHARVIVTNPDDTPGFLAHADKNLQAKGFVLAKQKLRVAACQAGILRGASSVGELYYGDLLRNALRAAGDVRSVKTVSHIQEC